MVLILFALVLYALIVEVVIIVLIKTIALVEKCPECRKEKVDGSWVIRETKVTTSKYCPPCEIKKRKELDDFIKTML